LKEQAQLLLAIAAIFSAASAALWLVMLPDDPKVALGNSAAAAVLASIVLLGKIRRDQGQR
jgi:hypothetical protein